jgi:hypothetical protein
MPTVTPREVSRPADELIAEVEALALELWWLDDDDGLLSRLGADA